MTRAAMGAKKRVWRSRGADRGCQLKSTPPFGKIADDVARIIAEVRPDTGDSGFHLVGVVRAAAMETAAGRLSQVLTKATRARPGSLRKVRILCRERSDA